MGIDANNASARTVGINYVGLRWFYTNPGTNEPTRKVGELFVNWLTAGLYFLPGKFTGTGTQSLGESSFGLMYPTGDPLAVISVKEY